MSPTEDLPLSGLTALVTGGPTYEPIDPVRFIGNRSSGRQGHALAAAFAQAGAATVLVTGPTALPDPEGVDVIHIETAVQMLAACEAHLPADVAVCSAAVGDWRIEAEWTGKIKKGPEGPPVLRLVENPDVLRAISTAGPRRPRLVVGFAAETEDVLAQARDKRLRKGCDWILANDVSPAHGVPGVFGGDSNRVHLITASDCEDWPLMSKVEIAERLVARVAAHLAAAH